MENSRRTFLKNSAFAIAGSALFSDTIFALSRPRQTVGVQLYSVRDDMKKDPLGTLKQLVGMGYKVVEHANYVNRKFYTYTAMEFRKVLDDLGLKMLSGHTVLHPQHWNEARKDFSSSWKYTVEDAAAVGQIYVISPSLEESWRKTLDDLKRSMDIFNRCGELCKKSGLTFGYHNHDFEFSQKLNDVPLYDLILKNTDPKWVCQQLDIGNLYNGGTTALDVLSRFPGRFQSLHVKDEVKAASGNPLYESTVLGNGIVQVKDVIDQAKKSGTSLFIVEQEAYQGKDPIESVKEDLGVMKSWGYY